MWLAVFITCFALAGIADAAQREAQPYPARPVRLIVSNTAGGPSDVVARLVAAKISESWGQQIVIDNRPARWQKALNQGGTMPAPGG
ncbi:MAG TPA: hypothetical protein VHP37_16785 [Burkholderiales bacterium]|nr:hypothetical protein [Burkholderiales bacterium]